MNSALTEPMPDPRVVCPGWGVKHPEPVVMKPGTEPVSHGMCEECQARMHAECEARR